MSVSAAKKPQCSIPEWKKENSTYRVYSFLAPTVSVTNPCLRQLELVRLHEIDKHVLLGVHAQQARQARGRNRPRRQHRPTSPVVGIFSLSHLWKSLRV